MSGHFSPGLRVYRERGAGKMGRMEDWTLEYCTLVGTGKRRGSAGKRGSSFPGWPIKVFLTFNIADLA